MTKSTERIARILTAALSLILLALVNCNGLTERLVRNSDANAPRDPDTGVLIGAEELRLGPEDASTAVLMVHGFVGGSSNFWELPERLAAAGHRVVAMRLPGHGTTPQDFAKTTAAELLDAVAAEANSLAEDHDKVILVGHSMGAALSTLATSRLGTSIVDGLVLGAPYFGVSFKWYYVLPAERWSALTGWALPWTYKGDRFLRIKRREAVPDVFSYRWIPAKGTATLIEIGKLVYREDVLGAVTCPVLMFHSQDDNAANPANARQAFEWIGSTDKSFVELENSDHHIFWDYEREMIADEIVSFVARIDNQS